MLNESKYEIYRGTNKNMEVNFCMYGRPYKMDENDKLVLTVLDYRNNDEIVIEKESIGDNFFSFVPSDTEELDVGFYVYSVTLYPEDSEEKYMAIKPSIFHIMSEHDLSGDDIGYYNI